MMKLLYVPTGNAFTLPDDEALRIMATDRGNYRIVEGGLQKEAKEVLPPETVKDLVMKQEEKVLEQEAADNPVEEDFDYTQLNKRELMVYAAKLGIPGATNNNVKKEALQALIKEKIGR